jgi:hypothetical protein
MVYFLSSQTHIVKTLTIEDYATLPHKNQGLLKTALFFARKP